MKTTNQSDLLELFPIKLVGGFIAIDSYAGCVGCSFCLSRRHSFWQKAFAANWRKPALFSSIDQSLEILSQMKSFTQARVPLRFGHNSDGFFQWDFASGLYKELPAENPCIILTRFPIPEKHMPLLQGQSNLLVKMTITPPSASLRISTDVEALLSQIPLLPPENLYVLIGPVAGDNWQIVPEILNRLPKGLWLDIKPLTRYGIPGMDAVPVCEDHTIKDLRRLASDKGFQVTDFFGCKLRKNLKRPFYKAGSAPDYCLQVCHDCELNQLCLTERRKIPRHDLIRQHAAGIGLEFLKIKDSGHRAVEAECIQPASRGDETYLSEITGTRISISSVAAGSEGGTFDQTTEEMLARWESHGLMPVTTLSKLAYNAMQSWQNNSGLS